MKTPNPKSRQLPWKEQRKPPSRKQRERPARKPVKSPSRRRSRRTRTAATTQIRRVGGDQGPKSDVQSWPLRDNDLGLWTSDLGPGTPCFSPSAVRQICPSRKRRSSAFGK